MKSHHIQLVLLMCAAQLYASEYAVLRNGFSVKLERHVVMGNFTRLYISSSSDSGYIDVSNDQIDHFERDELVPATTDSTPIHAAPVPPLPSAADLDALIEEAARRHHLSPDFIRSVIRTESGFNPRAVSPKGAKGLMQLMPKTAEALDVKQPFAAEQNVEGGVRYLRQLLEQYDYDPIKALAAYNAGASNVDRYHGLPPFRETRGYVAHIARDFNRRNAPAAPAKPAASGPKGKTK